MRILHYVDDNVLSWAKPYIQILDSLRNLSCENIVACRPGGTLADLLRSSNFEVHEYKPLCSSLPYISRGFAKIIHEVKPDIIHTRLSSAALIGGYWGKKFDVPVLATIDKFPKKKYYENANYILPCSTPVAEHMTKQGFSREKIIVLPNAVDVKFYERDEKIRNYIRNSEGLNEKQICFLGMGRFVDWKGFDDLLRAFAKFLEEIGEHERFYLWLAGDGPEREKLEALVDELNISNKVKFWGFVEDVRSILWGADIYVHPSWGDEAFGLSLLEAMSAGLPVIASQSGGMTEILNRSQGLLFPRRDVNSLINCMKECLTKSKTLSASALLRAWDFDSSVIAQKTFEIYEHVINYQQTP